MKNKTYTLVLWILLLLFCFRVLAQLVQYYFSVPFLPPFESWHSGTLPYGYLVGFQFIILFIYGRVCVRVTRGTIRLNRRVGKRWLILGSFYFSIMVIRYVLRMSMFPLERWTGGAIPIFFHLVLSSFLIVLGLYHVKNAAPATTRLTLTNRIIWTSIYSITSLLIPVWLLYQLLPSILANKMGWREAQYSVTIEKMTPIEMADQSVLYADIYRPERLSKASTILVRIPLDDNFKGRLMSNVVGRLWAERGYNVVIQGVRGRFHSKEKHVPFLPERADGIATLEWLNKQPWHNGKTGMWGGSYFGYTQWAISDQGSLGLKALLTQISSSSNYRMFYPSGTFSFETALFWAARAHSHIDTPQEYGALKKGYDQAPMLEADDRTVGNVFFYDEWATHDSLDNYWRAIDGTNRSSNLRIPILMMAGWYDPYLSSQVNDFEQISNSTNKRISEESRLIIGPWAHAETVPMPSGYVDQHYRLASLVPSLDWFDKHLNSSSKRNPRVKLFVMGINQWREEDNFPLERTHYIPYYLSGKEKSLSMDMAKDTSIQTYIYDPSHPVPSIGGAVLGTRAGCKPQNEVEKRDDVLVYDSPVLEKELEVTGKVKLFLYASSSAQNTDFTAKLVDVYPDGNAYNISEGILRANFKKESIEKIEIELNPTSNVFLKGHKIRLEVSSSNYPRYSLNYNTGGRNFNESKGLKAEQKIYTGKTYTSHLVLPIIP